MLRFYRTDLKNDNDIAINDRSLLMDGDIWQNCRSFLQGYNQKKDHVIDLIPVKDAEGELTAYGFQDHEANRELRMLRELRENAQALQFFDIFPEYQEVIIWGCNELAFFFAEYLKEQGIAVSVIGQYWNYFGYEACEQKDSLGETALVIYAEGIPLQNHSLYETVIRSASPEFECIDRIYEANVVEGRIHDTIGGLDEFIAKLKEEPEIVILGADRKAQDTYDLLMAHGIDIRGFAVTNRRDEMRLGRKIMSIEEAVRSLEHPIFLNYAYVHGALGEKWMEYFDYCGYKRNEQYFLVRDYADIPTSNLIHVLHGKKVWLTGDSRLCQLLTDYLNLIENGEVTVRYTVLGEKITAEEEDILCLVVPDYKNSKDIEENERKEMLRNKLADMGFIGHTEYYVCSRCFALIDLYLNKGAEKYGVTELLPQGILLGRIPYCNGNDFFRGILDGHPEVLLCPFSDFQNNMFYYCIRLANIDSDKVMPLFWEMYGVEASRNDILFLYPEIFEERVKRLLGLKEKFTSQELFVLFSIAYIEMISNRPISDVSKLVIYWEPHMIDRNEFPYYALWLEDRKMNGNTILLYRDSIVRTGSVYNHVYNYTKEHNMLPMSRPSAFRHMFVDEFAWNGENLKYQSWTEHKMRFEDIKTKPVEKLTEICEMMNIEWSDSMQHTTSFGEPKSFLPKGGSIDFDLKPVFNKYEDYFTEYDRFRISIASSPYQKRYGYTYDNCLKFTRREIQEMFLKPFLFDEKAMVGEPESDIDLYEWMRWQLWNVRKHMVLDDVKPEFDRFELENSGDRRMDEYRQKEREKKIKEIENSIEYIRNHDKLILYGTGNDCRGLLKLMEESTKGRLLYSDKKAESEPFVFQGKNVIAPKELCSVYKDYNILVTSSQYRRNIEYEFKNMGIDPSRVYYSGAEFAKEDNR